jgi:hypothetical protein
VSLPRPERGRQWSIARARPIERCANLRRAAGDSRLRCRQPAAALPATANLPVPRKRPRHDRPAPERGRVAQWESARFTRERSQVRNPPRPSWALRQFVRRFRNCRRDGRVGLSPRAFAELSVLTQVHATVRRFLDGRNGSGSECCRGRVPETRPTTVAALLKRDDGTAAEAAPVDERSVSRADVAGVVLVARTNERARAAGRGGSASRRGMAAGRRWCRVRGRRARPPAGRSCRSRGRIGRAGWPECQVDADEVDDAAMAGEPTERRPRLARTGGPSSSHAIRQCPSPLGWMHFTGIPTRTSAAGAAFWSGSFRRGRRATSANLFRTARPDPKDPSPTGYAKRQNHGGRMEPWR